MSILGVWKKEATKKCIPNSCFKRFNELPLSHTSNFCNE